MSDQKRTYRMKRRAELEQRTRERITEAAVELHGGVGPANTSVTAVADRAGVRRSTVYRHFPDEAALFAACSAHWAAANPPPDLGRWAAIEDPEKRLESALGELYEYYRSTERMMANLLRDESTMAVVANHVRGYRELLEHALDLLADGRTAGTRKRAAIGHALAFTTWRSLAREQQLDDREAVRLMCRLVECA
jgi:AcrR family transcriptional regulator